MSDIVHQICANHSERMAAARCLECGRFFCRECLTEHRGRVLCTACLVKMPVPVSGRRRHLTGLLRLLQWGLGVWLLWVFFYYVSRLLLKIPASFHEGTLWRQAWWGG